ncbi:MAG: GNAT family N-acetyltransferase [Halioglobus sp.]|nr:GNAT family N-acetyltransferase [Halioglobus sp.]
MRYVTRRLAPGDERVWRAAVERIIAPIDRDGELISARDFAGALADNRCYMLLAESGGVAQGLLSAYRFPDLEAGGSIVYLYDIEVVAAARQQGIGTSLLEALLALCDANDVSLVWAGTEAHNLPARRAFEATGAELEGERCVGYEWDLER